MNLIPWRNKERDDTGLEPARSTAFEFRNQLDRLFDRFFTGFPEWDLLEGLSRWGPDTDVTETDREMTVRVELPGIDPKDIQVSVTGDSLTITGQRKHESEKKGRGYYRTERHSGSFRRSMRLPPYVSADKAQAEYKNGVLTVHLDKDESARAKRVPVKSVN